MRSGLGLKFEGKLKPVMHYPAFIIKTKTAVLSPLRIAVTNLKSIINQFNNIFSQLLPQQRR
jgi:hypothetical protein